MWCTRYFVPLLLLPLPSAPPFFLLVFLLSLVVHARPCFYCILLLSALFVSSCHWSPVPLSAPLSRPLGNITTFGDALRPLLPPGVEPPAMVRLADRCWCDPALSRLFEPFDVLRWELASVRRAVPPPLPADNTTVADAANATDATAVDDAGADAPEPTRRAFASLFAPFTRRASESRKEEQEAAPVVVEEPPPPPPENEVEELRARPYELDMRPYGFPIMLDFAWWRRELESVAVA